MNEDQITELSVEREEAGRLEREWLDAGLHPHCWGIGCGTADFRFATVTERRRAELIAGDALLIDPE